MTVSWSPEQPVQGTLFRVRVLPSSSQVTGSFAGEPLHFATNSGGALEALAAAPLDQGAALELIVVATTAAGQRGYAARARTHCQGHIRAGAAHCRPALRGSTRFSY